MNKMTETILAAMTEAGSADQWSDELISEMLIAANAMLKAARAERARRNVAKTEQAAPALPLTASQAAELRADVERRTSRASARDALTGSVKGHKITVPQLRVLAKRWGVGVTTKMRKSDIIEACVDALVGWRLDSAAIARA